MGISSGNFSDSSDISNNKPVQLAIIVFKAKSTGLRNSLPFTNNLAENQPRSNIISPIATAQNSKVKIESLW